MLKTYVGISRDHSGSMQSIRQAAARDYNSQVVDLQNSAAEYQIATFVSTVKCGVGSAGRVDREHNAVNVNRIPTIVPGSYKADGNSTPLWDSVGELITMLEAVADANDPDVSFVVMVITDGGENSSRTWSADRLSRKIRELQAKDRWTFTFRVPTGYASNLSSRGIPEGNIYEWDGHSEASLRQASAATSQAIGQYYSNRTKGIHSTQKFYADLSKVSGEQVAAVCEDISAQVQLWPISVVDDGAELRPYVEKRTGQALLKGAAFYQLVKTEPKVQSYKKIAIRDKVTNAIYSGDAARKLLGVPNNVDIRLAPDPSKKYDIFIQSTSINRKLAKGTQLLYWPAVGKAFGPTRARR